MRADSYICRTQPGQHVSVVVAALRTTRGSLERGLIARTEAAGVRRHTDHARADARGPVLHRSGRAGRRVRADLRAAVVLRGPGRRDRRARPVHPAPGRARNRAAGPRQGPGDPGLPQRVPAPRLAAVPNGCRGHRQRDPLPVPQLDLRPGRCADHRAELAGDGRYRQAGLRPAPGAGAGMGGPDLGVPGW